MLKRNVVGSWWLVPLVESKIKKRLITLQIYGGATHFWKFIDQKM